jgi:hypothetical protein
MFFFSKTKKAPYCVVPMPERTQRAHDYCHEHAHWLSEFLRKHNLARCRFNLKQLTHTSYSIEGRVFFRIELITEECRKCVLKVGGTKGGVWVYTLCHHELSPNEIYNLLFSAFGKKEKIFVRNIVQEFVFRLMNRFFK